MKVILLSDVAKIGRRGSVVEVPDGYARNKLIPSGLAEPATKASLKKLEASQANQEAVVAEEASHFEAVRDAVHNTTIKVPAELNEKGHAFKAISTQDIIESAKTMGITIAESMVQIHDPIKEAGEHVIVLKRGDNEIKLTIEVVNK